MLFCILNILYCLLIGILFIYAMLHIPVQKKIRYDARKRLKRISIGLFFVYVFNAAMLFFWIIAYGEYRRSGMELLPTGEIIYSQGQLSSIDEFVYKHGFFIMLLTYFPTFTCGLSNIFIYGLKDKT